jgi:hypothetical protein
LALAGVYTAVRPSARGVSPITSATPASPKAGPLVHAQEDKWTGGAMAALMTFGGLGIGVSIDSVVQIAMFGVTTPMLSRLGASLCLLAATVVVTLILLRRIGIRLRGSEESPPHKVWGKLGLR